MAELTQSMVEARAERVLSGLGDPHMPQFPGLVFKKLDLADFGRVSRAYSVRLKELHEQGGLYSEALLPTVLQKLCAQAGLDVKVLAQANAIQRQAYEQLPDSLKDPFDQLTPEEVAQLSPEEQQKRQEAMMTRDQEIMNHFTNLYTPEQQVVLDQAAQVEALEMQLRLHTYEHHARAEKMYTELLLGCRLVDDAAQPYFVDRDDMNHRLAEAGVEAVQQLIERWTQWKAGANPGFFSPSSSVH